MAAKQGKTYLGSALVFNAGSFAEFVQLMERDDQPRRFFEFGPHGLSRISLARVSWSSGSLSFSHVCGGLLNIGSSVGRHLVLALPVAGKSTTYINGVRGEIPPGTAVMALPGDTAFHAMYDMSGFGLRVPLSRASMFRIAAMPYRLRFERSRYLDPSNSADLLRLMEFTSAEHDRSASPDSEQVEALGGAIVARTQMVVRSVISDCVDSDPYLLDLCLRCENVVRASEGRHFRSVDLADAVQCSVRQLYRAFAATADTTPAEYELRCRLTLARAQLVVQEEPDAVKIVARRHGFANLKSFYSAYEREYDESPEDTLDHKKLVIGRVVSGFA